MVYFLPASGAQLLEATNRFKVRSIVPVANIYADQTLMPDFPGIEDADSTRDWDAGFPLQHEIRPQDEAWWKDHRGTPKAYVSLTAGRQMWGNRFGEPHRHSGAAGRTGRSRLDLKTPCWRD